MQEENITNMIQPAPKPQTKAKKPLKVTAKKPGELAPIKGRGGSPPHEPSKASRNLVLLALTMGQTHAQIAKLIGIGLPTLQKHYAAELEDGGQRLLLGIAGNLASIAQDPNHPKAVTAAIFWLKTKGGFRENVPTVDEPGDEKITFTINIGGSGPPQKLPGDGAKLVNG